MVGFVYSETVVWAAPASHAAEAPYQLAIVDLESGERVSVRIGGDRVAIGDLVQQVESRDGTGIYSRVKEAPKPDR
jgi:uncharacterized OB-fold protein